MKSLILKILVIVFPITILLIAVELHMRKLPNSYSYKKQMFEESVSSVEILFLGNSHAYYGINPDRFKQKAFNMANVSQSLYYDKELFIKYIKSMKNLKTVVIPISYFTLENEITDGMEFWRCYNYERYYNITFPVSSIFNALDMRKYSVAAQYGNTICRESIINGLSSRLIKNVMPNGWYRAEATDKNINDVAGKGRARYHHSIMNSDRIVYNTKIIGEMIGIAKSSNVDIVIVSLPVDETYYSSMDTNKRSIMIKTIESLANEYRIDYFDFMQNPYFVGSDFFDSDHLNLKGADKFSTLLASLLKPRISVHKGIGHL